jgi:hypothetical protein
MIIGRNGAEQEEVARKVEPAEDLSNDWHDDVISQAGHDLGEGGADDDRDGEVENIPFGDKSAEFLEHSRPPLCRPCDSPTAVCDEAQLVCC